MFKNLEVAVQMVEDELTLKSDYSEELERLDGIYSDIAVMRHLGVPVWKCVDLQKKIDQIRNWMKEEESNQ